MSILSLALLILIYALRAYLIVLWARFILEWVRVVNPAFRPRKILLFIAELVYTVTDPPLRFIRKVLPPVRIGQVQLDLGLMLTMLAVWIAISLLQTLRFTLLV